MDWPALLRFAAVELHLPPHLFWRLSLKEWRALTDRLGPPPLSRPELDALTGAYPDPS